MDPDPLRPANTSSPQDTLRSFFANMQQRIELWYAGAPLDLITKSRTRAAETLVSSKIPSSGSL